MAFLKKLGDNAFPLPFPDNPYSAYNPDDAFYPGDATEQEFQDFLTHTYKGIDNAQKRWDEQNNQRPEVIMRMIGKLLGGM